MARHLGYKDCEAEGGGRSYAGAPVGKMKQLAETGNPRFARREGQPIDEVVEEIQTVRDVLR